MTARGFDARLHGSREDDCGELAETDVSSNQWTELPPEWPNYRMDRTLLMFRDLVSCGPEGFRVARIPKQRP